MPVIIACKCYSCSVVDISDFTIFLLISDFTIFLLFFVQTSYKYVPFALPFCLLLNWTIKTEEKICFLCVTGKIFHLLCFPLSANNGTISFP
uniref:Uncharacterized protein n=1 Tax=Rhizophora mucronata TaxID=61149 RepID=A0A2P2NX62_RHIMU